MNSTIEKFKTRGYLYIWKYVEDPYHYPGWNITGDNEGCDSLSELLEMMDKSAYPSRKSITANPATTKQVSVANGGRYKTFDSLSLHYKRDGQIKWAITETGEGLRIEFNGDKMQEFKTSIQRIKKHGGDFAIFEGREDKNILYFWWNL